MVNKNIKEIGTRAGVYMEEHYDGGFPNESLLVVEDYAIQLIEKCIRLCSRHITDSEPGQTNEHNEAIMMCVNSIQDHFGIRGL